MIQRIIIFFFLALSISIISLVSLKYALGDFDVYYDSSQHYLNRSPVYVAHGGINEFKYSPLFALLFSPLTLIKRLPALYIWTVLNLLCFYGIFILLCRLKLFSMTNLKDLLIVICLFALMGRYLFSNFKLGQINMLLCFLMVLTMYFEITRKYFLAALVLAFSLMIKFFPLLFVLYFILTKRFKLLAYTALLLGVFLLLPALYSGWDLNLKYLHDWFELLKSSPPKLLYSVKNNSLLSFFSWFFVARHEPFYVYDYDQITKGLDHQVYYAWAISCLILFVTYFNDAFFVKDKEVKVVYLDYACLFVCALLFNPLAYLNALTFLIIPYYFILRHLFYSPLSRKYLILIGLPLFLSFVMTVFDNRVFFKDIYLFYDYLQIKPLMCAIIFTYISLCATKLSLMSSSRYQSL